MSDLRKQKSILDYHNELRRDPTVLIEDLEEMKEKFNDKNQYKLNDNIIV